MLLPARARPGMSRSQALVIADKAMLARTVRLGPGHGRPGSARSQDHCTAIPNQGVTNFSTSRTRWALKAAVYCLRIVGDALSISAFLYLNSGVHYNGASGASTGTRCCYRTDAALVWAGRRSAQLERRPGRRPGWLRPPSAHGLFS